MFVACRTSRFVLGRYSVRLGRPPSMAMDRLYAISTANISTKQSANEQGKVKKTNSLVNVDKRFNTGNESDDCEFKQRLREFGEDTGPRLDLSLKLKNQQRVVDKVNTSYRSVGFAIVGNFIITVTKFTAAVVTGSSVLLSEAIHTLVDTINQGLLLVGLLQSRKPPDTIHQHGYARSAYFYSLLSGFGMFVGGSTFIMYNAVIQMYTLDHMIEYGYITWVTLGISFAVDGFVLSSALYSIYSTKGPRESLLYAIKNSKDPYLRAVLLEDSVACLGVLSAVGGIGLCNITGNPIYDPLASGVVSILLGLVAISLMNMNRHFLLSKAIDPDIQADIVNYLLSRDAVKRVGSIETAWEGPVSFSFKSDIDFDGSYIASVLFDRYQDKVYMAGKDDLRILLTTYTEDVARVIENEVYYARLGIAERYPEATFIDLQPHCTLNKETALEQLYFSRNKEKMAKDVPTIITKE